MAAARQKGLESAEFIRKFLTESLPAVINDAGNASPSMRDPDLVARVRAVRGKYAYTVQGSGSGELHRERQRDKAKEEAQIRRDQPWIMRWTQA